MPMISRRKRFQTMSQINVVPYIDVMLVLLIVFMITAPLLTQGVKVELPQCPEHHLNWPCRRFCSTIHTRPL